MIDSKDPTLSGTKDNAPTSRVLHLVLLTVGAVATLALCLELISLVAGLTDRTSVLLLVFGPVLLVPSIVIRPGPYFLHQSRRSTWATVACTSGAVAFAAWLPDALNPEFLGRTQCALILAGGIGFVAAIALYSIANKPAEEPEKGPARLVRVLMIASLALSFTVTALTSSVLAPLGGPDESAHYSYVKHVAENPLEFPPRFEDRRIGDGEPNHLIHPPLYYQFMALPYWMLDVDRHLSSAGTDADAHGTLSAPVVVPPLRAASLSLVVVHLTGLYVLLAYLVRRSVLPGWGAVIAAAALGLVPGFTFIAGTLNNDVLALAIWPFLALTTIRYFFDEERKFAYAALLLGSMAALTKATLLPLVAMVATAIVGIAVARAARKTGDDASSGLRGFARRLWLSVRPVSKSQWTWFLVALGSASLVVFYFASMYSRYGALQPSYTAVYGLLPEDSKFRNIPEGGIVERAPLEFSMSATTLLFRSLFGILAQQERIYHPNPEHFAYLIMALTAVGIVLATYGMATTRSSESRRSRIWLASSFLATTLLFMAVFLVRSFARYHEHGYYGVQGRYLIGYIDLWLIGLIALAWLTFRGTAAAWSRVLAGLVAGVIAVAIVWAFVDPFFYLQRTRELEDRIEAAPIVLDEDCQHGAHGRSTALCGSSSVRGEGSGSSLLMVWRPSKDTMPLAGHQRSGGPVEQG